MLGQQQIDHAYVDLTSELDLEDAYSADPDFKVAVGVEHPRRFDGEGADLIVGKTPEVLLRARKPLNVQGDDPPVGKPYPVARVLVSEEYALVGDEHGSDEVRPVFGVDLVGDAKFGE